MDEQRQRRVFRNGRWYDYQTNLIVEDHLLHHYMVCDERGYQVDDQKQRRVHRNGRWYDYQTNLIVEDHLLHTYVVCDERGYQIDEAMVTQ